jgi:hypothetical protein
MVSWLVKPNEVFIVHTISRAASGALMYLLTQKCLASDINPRFASLLE